MKEDYTDNTEVLLRTPMLKSPMRFNKYIKFAAIFKDMSEPERLKIMTPYERALYQNLKDGSVETMAAISARFGYTKATATQAITRLYFMYLIPEEVMTNHNNYEEMYQKRIVFWATLKNTKNSISKIAGTTGMMQIIKRYRGAK